MKYYTVHTKRDAAPVLVREGFCWGAALFGPFWLLARRAFVPAAIVLAVSLVVASRTDGRIGAVLSLTLAVLLGLTGRDLWRWSLDRRGFATVHVVAAASEDAAYARLLAARPDLTDHLVPTGLGP